MGQAENLGVIIDQILTRQLPYLFLKIRDQIRLRPSHHQQKTEEEEEEEEEEDKGRGEGGQAEGKPKHLQKPQQQQQQQGAVKQKGWTDLREEEVEQLPEALRTVRSKRKNVWRFLLTLERSKWEQFEALLAKHGRLLSRQEWLQEMVSLLGASAEVAAYCHDNHQIFSDGCLAMEEARQMYFDRVWWSIPPKKTKQKKKSRRKSERVPT